MTTNTCFFKTTMGKAKDVQMRYEELGAAPTQNVRNPLPMHQLVLTVLPTLPRPWQVVESKVKIVREVLGQRIVEDFSEKTFAEVALGKSYWEERALTVDEVVHKLEAKGFLVRRGNVAAALSHLPNMSFSKDGKRGRFCRYFVGQ